MKKIILSILMVVAFIAGSSTDANAAQCSNEITGPFSINRCEIINEVRQRVSVHQEARIHTDVDVHVSTGHNIVAFNTLAGSITTGPATSTIEIHNFVNQSKVTVTH